MIDAQLEVQGAIYAAVTGSPIMQGLIGTRIYDAVPTNQAGQIDDALFPFVSFGPMTSTDDGDGCHNLVAVSVQLDCWSRAVGWPEVKRISAVLVKLLNAKIPVPGFRVIIHEVERVISTRELDRRTSRVAIHLRYRLAPSA
jgi:hypothetical protein